MDATKQGQGGPAAPQPKQAGTARWLIWSREHTAFWRPLKIGYTVNLDEAGRYDTLEANAIVDQAKLGRDAEAPAAALMFLAPECSPGDLLLDSLSSAELDAIAAFLACTGLDVDGNTHGTLTIGRLVQMLLEDVALAIHRPGSWEGAGMNALLAGHGYTYHQGAVLTRALRVRWWGGKSPYDTEPQP